MARCLVATGANLGDRRATLHQAAACLSNDPRVSLLASSELFETVAIGGPTGQDPFLNGSLLLETSRSPEQLLALLERIQQQLGRVSAQRWAARALDLDLLLYENQVLRTPQLTLPHPRMTFRRFVLQPAAQIAPDMMHPQCGWTVRRLLEHLGRSPEYVSIIGPPGVGKTRLAEVAAQQSAGRAVFDDRRPEEPPGPEPDPTGQPWDRSIELLQCRASLLQASSWPDAAGPAISDFWFDQSLAYARLELPSSQYDAFVAQWQTARERVVSPKLVVWLDSSAEWPEEQMDTAWPGELRRTLRQQIRASDVGPFLDLDGRDLDDAAPEVVAAIQAMR